jgi:copper homeostasis protein
MNAQKGGADRIELCDNPAEGGTTPSYGTIDQVRQSLSIDVFVMIRPRGGDFLYTNYEYHAMRKDIEACKRLSVDGVVFGILKADGSLDKERCKKLIDYARPMRVTCHRAFDMARDPFQTLEDCIEVGFDRILTAGQQAQALQGASLIGELQQRAAGRIAIMAGSGVNENTVEEIVRQSRVREIHFSATSGRSSLMTFRNTAIAGMGSDEGAEFQVRTVDPMRVEAMRKLAEAVEGKQRST